MKNRYNAIDLFSGAGGFSEGFLETKKFDFLAHVEWEVPMVMTLRNNLVKQWNYTEKKALERVVWFDVQKTYELINGDWSDEAQKKYGENNSELMAKKGLNSIIGSRKIDIIIGGPPCQAYSLAGRAQDKNSMKDDYRNYLFESFVRLVNYYKPKVFVFENVPGILSAKPGDRYVIDRIYESFKSIGYQIRKPNDMKKSIYSSSDFEVPQNRRRIIIFGVRDDIGKTADDFYRHLDLLKSKNKITVRDAIEHLPKFRPLSEPRKVDKRNVSHAPIGDISIPYHDPRYHNSRDIKIFNEWLSNSMNNISNSEKLKYYTLKTGRMTNHNKYRSLEWDKPSPTIVSHLYKDGLMFIHPDINQLRSITIKEAALLQTFPDSYEFVGSNASAFKMIGNAVPIMFAKKIGMAVLNALEE